MKWCQWRCWRQPHMPVEGFERRRHWLHPSPRIRANRAGSNACGAEERSRGTCSTLAEPRGKGGDSHVIGCLSHAHAQSTRQRGGNLHPCFEMHQRVTKCDSFATKASDKLNGIRELTTEN